MPEFIFNTADLISRVACAEAELRLYAITENPIPREQALDLADDLKYVKVALELLKDIELLKE